MDVNNIRPGLRVRTIADFGPDSTRGFLIAPKNLQDRKPNTPGIVITWVPGHGGDVWYVLHDGENVPQAYSFPELELACELCGDLICEGQRFCGAACSQRWEAHERPNNRAVDQVSRAG